MSITSIAKKTAALAVGAALTTGMTATAADAGWAERIDAAKTAGTFKTRKGATQAQRDAYLAKFDASPKPLGYMPIGGVNRWMVPIGEGFRVLFR